MPFSSYLRGRTNWSFAVYLLDQLSVPPSAQPHTVATTIRLFRRPRHIHTKADPFLYNHGGRLYAFYETQSVDDPGCIAVAEVTSDGMRELGTILSEPGHLSYPSVFSIGSEIYLIPESAQLGEVRLYRFADFPRRPEFVRALLHGQYVDTSPVEVDGHWYLFTTSARGLELYETADLVRGELELHPSSPITSDSRYSRSAGVPFKLDGTLVRPAQNCSVIYGGNVNLMAIEILSRSKYRERLLRSDIFSGGASWNRNGAHHVSVAAFGDKVAVAVDGQASDYYIYKWLMRAWMIMTRYRRFAP